jgi:hypothetical protein
MAEIIEGNKLKLKNGTVITLDDVDEGVMLKADHTRKTQELAEDRKRFDGVNIDALKADAEEAGKWRNFWSNPGAWDKDTRDYAIKGLGINPGNSGAGNGSDFQDDSEKVALVGQIKSLETTIKNLEKTGGEKITTLESNQANLQRALRYSRKIENLRYAHNKSHPDIEFDEAGILKAAGEYGKSELNEKDWDILYNDRYREDFEKIKVDRLVKEQLAAEKEKEKAARINDQVESSKPINFFKKPETFTHDAKADAVRLIQQRKAERGETV